MINEELLEGLKAVASGLGKSVEKKAIKGANVEEILSRNESIMKNRIGFTGHNMIDPAVQNNSLPKTR